MLGSLPYIILAPVLFVIIFLPGRTQRDRNPPECVPPDREPPERDCDGIDGTEWEAGAALYVRADA